MRFQCQVLCFHFLWFYFSICVSTLDYKQCDSTNAVTFADVEPCADPKMCSLKRGSFLKLRVNFKSDTKVDLAKAQVFGSLGGELIPYSLDLPDTTITCNDQKNTSQCPLKVGDNFFALSVKISEFYPTIPVPITWKMVDQKTQKTIACLKFRSKIVE